MKHKYPLLVNIYPYFSYIGNTQNIRIKYALFTSPLVVVQDGSLGYQKNFYAILYALYSALEKANGRSLKIVVSETGWLSQEGLVTIFEYVSTYNLNLIQHVKGGTPKRPMETYMYAMMMRSIRNPTKKNQKISNDVKNWGLFDLHKKPKYQIKFN